MPAIPASRSEPTDIILDLRTFGALNPFGTSIARVQIIGHDGRTVWAHVSVKPPANHAEGMSADPAHVVLGLTVIGKTSDTRREATARPWQAPK